jgi:hypothetical protein
LGDTEKFEIALGKIYDAMTAKSGCGEKLGINNPYFHRDDTNYHSMQAV